MDNNNLPSDKPQRYQLLVDQVKALVAGDADAVSVMANVSAAIHQAMGFFWTGFYRTPALYAGNGGNDNANELRLGPFQGPVACTRIGYGRGVCGTAWKQRQTIVVPDVLLFPGHIACSSLSRSEIVVPVVAANGDVLAVLDIDSTETNTFDHTDQQFLEQIAGHVARAIAI